MVLALGFRDKRRLTAGGLRVLRWSLPVFFAVAPVNWLS